MRILCFGDSNTWGFTPGTSERFPENIRWTGILQEKLGSIHKVIEEGLNARTTNSDDPEFEGKNGATYLKPCLQTHSPIDIFILMLGTNDLKEKFAKTPTQIVQGIEELLHIIKNTNYNYNHEPKIILLSPPIVDEGVPQVQGKFLGAQRKSQELGKLYESLASKYNANFIDTSKLITSSKTDGVHLEASSHKILAEAIYKSIINWPTN